MTVPNSSSALWITIPCHLFFLYPGTDLKPEKATQKLAGSTLSGFLHPVSPRGLSNACEGLLWASRSRTPHPMASVSLALNRQALSAATLPAFSPSLGLYLLPVTTDFQLFQQNPGKILRIASVFLSGYLNLSWKHYFVSAALPSLPVTPSAQLGYKQGLCLSFQWELHFPLFFILKLGCKGVIEMWLCSWNCIYGINIICPIY